MTTKDIIKLLPLEASFKTKLLEGYEQMPGDKRFALEQAAWEMYDAYLLGKIEENLQLALLNAETENKNIINPELYEKVKAETEKEVQEQGIVESEKVDLSSARDQLAQIIGTHPTHDKSSN